MFSYAILFVIMYIVIVLGDYNEWCEKIEQQKMDTLLEINRLNRTIKSKYDGMQGVYLDYYFGEQLG